MPWKIVNGRQSSFSLGVYVNGIARAFNWIIAWVGFCTSSPQEGVKYQLCYMDFFGGHPIYNPCKIDNGRQSPSHLQLRSKVLPGRLSDISAWLGFCTSSRQQGVNYQLWYLDFLLGGPYKYHMKNSQRRAKFFFACGLDQRYLINIPWTFASGRQSSFSLRV
jgi:hypothetical protein